MGASERLQWTGEWDMSDGGCTSQMLGARRPRDQSGFNQHTAESVCSALKLFSQHATCFYLSAPHETWNTGVVCVRRTEPNQDQEFYSFEKNHFWLKNCISFFILNFKKILVKLKIASAGRGLKSRMTAQWKKKKTWKQKMKIKFKSKFYSNWEKYIFLFF